MWLAKLATPFAARLMLAGLIALGGALGAVWWSYSAQINSLTAERDQARVERDTAQRDVGRLEFAIGTQNNAIELLALQREAAELVAQGWRRQAEQRATELQDANAELRARPLPVAPEAACKAADDLILEFVR